MSKQRIEDFLNSDSTEETSSIPKLDPILGLNPVRGTQTFKESQTKGSLNKPVRSGRKIDDFLGKVSDINLDDADLEQKRTDNQSGTEQAANAVGQFGAQFLGGASMALGTTLDMEQSFNVIRGVEKEYNNMLFSFGKDLIDKGRTSMPIYQDKPGEFSPGDSGWWAQMFADTGLSAGIMAESMVETMAISALTEGTGLASSLGNMGKKLRNLTGMKALAGVGNTASKLRSSATMFGVINRHHEGIMEAADTFEQERAKLISKGKTEEEATDIASKAASATYLGNLPLMALDIMQFRAMTFNPIFGGSTGGIVENVLGGIKNKVLAKGVGQAFGIGSEGAEEFWQYLVQEEAGHYGDNLAGIGNNSKFADRFKEYTSKGEIWNATASGVMGGLLLGGASKLFQAATEDGSRKALSAEYDKFVNSISGIGVELVDEINKATEAGDEGKAANLRRGMGMQKALHAIHLDNMKDSDTAFSSYTGYMQGLLDAVNSGDAAQIESLGLTGQEEFLKEAIPDYLKDATKIQSIYNEVKGFNNRDAVVPITYRRFLQDNLAEEAAGLQSQIMNLEATMPDLANVSNPGREINNAQINVSLYQADIAKVQAKLKETDLSSVERDGLNSQLMNLNLGIEKNKQIIEEQKEAVAQLPESQKTIDNEILNYTNQNVQLKQLKQKAVTIESNQAKIRKELNLWTDPKFQLKNRTQQLYEVIGSSNTVDELTRTEQTLMQEGVLNTDLRERVTNKRKELIAREEAKALVGNVTEVSTKSPIEEMMETPAPTPPPSQDNPFGGIQGMSAEEQEAEFLQNYERQATAAALFEAPASPVPVKENKPTNNLRSVNNWAGVIAGDQVVVGKDKKQGAVTSSEEGKTSIRFPDGTNLDINNFTLFEVYKIVPTQSDPLENSEVSAKATVIKQEDLFEPAPLSNNISDNQREGIRQRLAEYYTSLAKDLGRNPTFRELVEDMIGNTSAEQVDKNFNIIKLGWEANNYAKTNFDQVYNDLFGTRKSKANDFFDFGQNLYATEQENNSQEEQISEREELAETPAEAIEETETGQKVIISTSKFQTVESTLKFAHLSQTYVENITNSEDALIIDRQTNTDDLNQNEFVDSRELMNPNLYQPGTVLTVRVPENMDDILLTNWSSDFTIKSAQTYGEWKVGKSSEQIDARIPMIIYNGDKPVAFIHDSDWYNPTNIGHGEQPGVQGKIISDAKAELMNFRKEVVKTGNLKITITEKRPGTKIVIPMNQPRITIAEANPQALIGYPNDNGSVVVGKDTISFDQLMNTEPLERGHRYDLRQSGINPDGSKQYFASKVNYSVLDTDSQKSVVEAIRVYMSQFDAKQELSNQAEILALKDKVKAGSGLNLFDQRDLESYLNIFIQTYKGKAKTNISIAEDINSNDKILTGTPWLAISEGRLVFGIKGIKLSQQDKDGNALYMHPNNFKNANSAQMASITLGNLKKIFAPNYLGAMKQNLGKEQLADNTPVVMLSGDAAPVSYSDFLKSKLTTNLRSIRLEDGTYTTFTQPVIHYTYENQPVSVTPQGTEVLPKVEEAIIAPTPPQATEAELVKSITDALGEFGNLGLSTEAMTALTNLVNNENISFDPDYARLTDDIVISLKRKLTKVEDLDTVNRNTVVQFIANQVMTMINPQDRNTISKKELITDISKSFNTIIAPKVKLVDSKIEALKELHATGKYAGLQVVIDELGNLRNNAEVLRKNWNFLINEAFTDYIEKFTGIAVTMSRDQNTVNVEILDEDQAQELTTIEDDQEFNIEDGNQRDKDYSKESVEDNGKNSVSYLVKRFLSQIPEYDPAGQPKKGYMGITTYPGFDFYYDAIGKVLSSPTLAGSTMEDIIIRLNQHKEKPWVAEVIKRLEESDDQLKNAFMYNFSRETLSMKFVMYSHSEKDGYSLKVYDTNANEINRVIQTQWRENFKQSGLVVSTAEGYSVNTQKAEALKAQFNSWTQIPSKEVAKAWLSEFGIELSTDSMNELIEKGYRVMDGNKSVAFPYASMFRKSDSTNGVFGILAKSLDLMLSASDKSFQTNQNINPFDNMSAGGILGKLSFIESKYTLNVTTNSFRDGSKSIFGYTPSKFVTGFMNKLKTDPSVIAAKKQISFDKNSYLMGLMENDEDFSSKFILDHLGINAFKELGKKLYQDNEINSLADADHELVKLGMFQDTQQGEVKTKIGNLSFRIGRMFLPTMSDKKTMLSLSTAVLKLNSKHFELSEGATTIDPEVKQFLFTQTIEPELKRIIAHHKKAKSLSVNPNGLINQKGYNLGAQVFNMIPAMNNVTFQGVNRDIRLIEYLADSAGMITDENYDALVQNIKGQTDDLIDNLFHDLSEKKIQSWDENGFFDRPTANNATIANVKYLNKGYMDKITGDMTTKIKVAALDFVINSALTNANVHMLFVGDVANYSQDKAFKNRFELDSNNQPIPYRPINDTVYADMIAGVTAVNLGKRLAMLVAPGSTIAQSKGDRYVQLFLKDRESMSENIEFLIKLYYGEQALQEAKSDIESNNVKSLMSKFPDIDAYFAIESTDAQEYTTAKEHLDVMYRQGRVTVAQYEKFIAKIKAQKLAEQEGRSIPTDAILSDADLKTIFQPIKPVYTGQINDTNNDVSRMVYIKSSSFPLLPQMTSAFSGLDSLRKKMEQLEDATGRNVRASYDTANKVGAVLGMRQLDIWNQDGSFNEDAINVEDIKTKLEAGDDTSAMYLDREFFRIQQDVPFKSTKIDHQDSITLGTQMMKLIFGDGIMDEQLVLNGKSISGRKLHEHYSNMFNSWISTEKSKLYSSLGIDEATGEPIDKSKTVQKLQNILQEEARKRGYPKQDVEALELDSNGDLNDNIQFTIPLWLSPNSNRYEALLNAIVTNRLLNLKLPGASFVAGSEEGFKVSEDLTTIDQSKVIFTSNWTGELKGASDTNLAQILVPSKFRDSNGKLLDLLKKDDQNNYIYVSQAENGSFRLNENMLDSELMSNSTFRIPTSSLVSMAEVDIVGFLPTESGDLIIVPKNFTKQKGLDFDVDKENMYMLHHMVNSAGRVVPIDQNEYGATYDNIKEQISAYEDYLSELRTKSQENAAAISEYEEELKITEGFDKKYVKGLISELKQDVSKSDIKDVVNAVKELKELEVKLYQNEIIRVYSAVLSSKNKNIQQKINKVLSTDFAESQANLIDSMVNQAADNSNFTILSDEYQKYKMSLGAAGKLGIGVYSNYVVFHSLVQQSPKPITLMKEEFDEEGSVKMVPFKLNIGGVVSDGQLGKINTLDGGRSITDVNAERQNTATDNEKLQIMGKTNINEVTINVDALLSIMGFDKATATIDGKKQDVSIPYLLMSQPVIRDYVDEIRKTKSNIAGYNPNAEGEVYSKLSNKYGFDLTRGVEQMNKLEEAMTGRALVDGVQGLPTGVDQQAVLELFITLKGYGEQVAGLQKKLNLQSSGLGKSVFEMIEKYDNVKKLQGTKQISNIDSLVGEFVTGQDFMDQGIDQLISDGFTIFDDDPNAEPYAVKPNTVIGSLIVNASKAGYQLWSDYFPHQNAALNKNIKDIMKLISSEEASETKKVQLQTEIFQEVKKFLYSSSKIGMYTGDAQQERNRLFFDRGGNQSLASYLAMTMKGETGGKNLLATNKLTGKFVYTLEKEGMPSLIKYNNSNGEDFNEEYKYLALVELMDKNMPLLPYNGQPYTSRMLARDLINYSYLQGGIQQATEFIKYIPVPYLKEMGFADATQKWQQGAKGNMMVDMGGSRVDTWSAMLGMSIQEENTPTRFTIQYLQHNPQRLPKEEEKIITTPEYSGPKLLSNVKSFSPNLAPDQIKPFIAIYNKDIPKGRPKYQIYQYDGNRYQRLSVLGVSGMSEYSIRSNDVVPLVDTYYAQSGVINKPVVPVATPTVAVDDYFNLEAGNLTQSLELVAKAGVPAISSLMTALLPYIDNSTKIETGIVNGGNSRGGYSAVNNTIMIDQSYIKSSGTSKDMLARTITHEYVHALTSRVLNKYFDKAGNPIVDKLPPSMTRLHSLFNEMQKSLGPQLDSYREWYKSNPGQYRTDSERVLYAGLNIHEFVAMIMTEEGVQKLMSETPYAQSGRSLLQQFINSIKQVLAELGIQFKEGSITTEAMDAVFAILEENKTVTPITPPTLGIFGANMMSVTDQDMNDLLNKEDMNDDDKPDPSEFLEPNYQQEELDKDCIF